MPQPKSVNVAVLPIIALDVLNGARCTKRAFRASKVQISSPNRPVGAVPIRAFRR